MDPQNRDLDRLEEKITRLKREYDLFLAGRRRTEPSALRDEVAREVLQLTRFPYASTAARFRVRSLAHRFQAVETQLRNLQELRSSRTARGAAPERAEGDPAVVLDRAALAQPAAVAGHLARLHKAVSSALGDRPGPSVEELRKKLLAEAGRLLQQPGVRGVRFTVVDADGRPKIRGDVLNGSSD